MVSVNNQKPIIINKITPNVLPGLMPIAYFYSQCAPVLIDQDREYIQNADSHVCRSLNEGSRNTCLNRYKDNAVYMVPNQELRSDKAIIEEFINEC